MAKRGEKTALFLCTGNDYRSRPRREHELHRRRAGTGNDVGGWRFLPEYWGKGLATEAARAVMHYGFDTFRFGRLVCVPRAANRRSIRVAEKLGMAFERSFVHNGKEVVCYAKEDPSGRGQGEGAGA